MNIQRLPGILEFEYVAQKQTYQVLKIKFKLQSQLE
jgi:hypothetical protein